MRIITRKSDISDQLVLRMTNQELGLKLYKMQEFQLSSDENKRLRLQRCRQLFRRATGQQWDQTTCTDEKLLTLERTHNCQNDRRFPTEAPCTSASSKTARFGSMSWYGGIWASGKTLRIFVEWGAKIDKNVYQHDIFNAAVLL